MRRMSVMTRPDMLNTTEASNLIGRSQSAVRTAIRDGDLKGQNHEGRWYIDRQELLAWHKRARILKRRTRPAWEAIADLLIEYDSASVEELTVLSGLHEGNVRKHLACLVKEGRVERRPDKQWILITQAHDGAA